MKPPRSVVALFPNVTSCTDARTPVGISVSKSDVKSSTSGAPQDCAMAKAICREWKADSALVGLSYSYVIKGNKAVRFMTPQSVAREIVSFDRQHDFAPGNYHLAAIPKSQRRKKPGGPRKPRASHQPKRRVFHGETLNVRSMR